MAIEVIDLAMEPVRKSEVGCTGSTPGWSQV